MFSYCNSSIKPQVEWEECQTGTLLQPVNLWQGHQFKAGGFWQLRNIWVKMLIAWL